MERRAKGRKKVGRARQRAAAMNLARGMSAERAMVEAGYSPNYAHSKAYQVVKRSYIQSIITESVDRVMKTQNLAFDAIVKPYVDGLTAKIIVKSTQLGGAQEVELPDHATRMNAADRIVELYGGRTAKEKAGSIGDVTIVVQGPTPAPDAEGADCKLIGGFESAMPHPGNRGNPASAVAR